MQKAVLWDFEGTLAERPGRWTGALLEVLDQHEPGHGVPREALGAGLQTGFPWHTWERPHPELAQPGAWWRHLEGVLAAAYEGVGCSPSVAQALAGHAGRAYAQPGAHRVFPDTRPALERLKEDGWRHLVLSNHVPELPAIIEGLGLGDLVDEVITSAAIGYEKPHPEAFRIARRRAGDPERLWMVGDDARADVWGATQAGLPAIRVRRGRSLESEGPREARDLVEAATLLLANGAR